jgi:transcription initiation factor IIE alpha subunit
MKKADQNILNRFYDTFAPVQISDYKKKHGVTDKEIKRALIMQIASIEHGHIFVRKANYTPPTKTRCNTQKMCEVLECVKNGMEYSEQIAEYLQSSKESIRQYLYRAFKDGILQRQEIRGKKTYRYYI